MKTIVLIGTSHKYQCATDGVLSKGVAEFRSEVEKLCRAHAIAALAEEMSLNGLTYQGASESVLQQISASLSIPHQFSDPSSTERSELGVRHDNDIRAEHFLKGSKPEEIEADVFARGSVPSDRIREQFWMRKIIELNAWPLIFVCGADHFRPFEALLTSNGFLVVEAHVDWEPSDGS